MTNADAGAVWFQNGDAYEGYVGRWSRPVGRLFLKWLQLPGALAWVDVGSGTGALTQLVVENAAPRSVIGVEPSAGYMAFARSRVSDARVEFRPGNAQELALDAASVDAAVSGLVLNFVPDKEAAMHEMRRVVRPGGTIAAYVWDYAGEMQLMRRFWDAVAAVFPADAGKDEGHGFTICNPVALTGLFESSGLVDVETTALDTPTVFRDFDDYWGPFLRGQGPAGAYAVSLPDDDRERLRRHLDSSLPRNADGSISMTARAWAVRGTQPQA
jgi:SAM-dependent methyltransferase